MTAEGGGPSHLRPVPAGGVASEAVAQADHVDPSGLTPPQKRAGSRFISDVIVEMGFVPQDRVTQAVEEAKASGRTPEQVLVESGALTGDQLARATAQRFGLTHADMSIYKADVGALNLINGQAAKRFNAAPIGFDNLVFP